MNVYEWIAVACFSGGIFIAGVFTGMEYAFSIVLAELKRLDDE